MEKAEFRGKRVNAIYVLDDGTTVPVDNVDEIEYEEYYDDNDMQHEESATCYVPTEEDKAFNAALSVNPENNDNVQPASLSSMSNMSPVVQNVSQQPSDQGRIRAAQWVQSGMACAPSGTSGAAMRIGSMQCGNVIQHAGLSFHEPLLTHEDPDSAGVEDSSEECTICMAELDCVDFCCSKYTLSLIHI